MRLQHLFIVQSKERHRTKDKFKEFQVQIRFLCIGPCIGSNVFHSLQQIFDKNSGKDGRGLRMSQERIGNDLKSIIFMDSLNDIINHRREHFSKNLRMQSLKDSSKMFQNFFLFFRSNLTGRSSSRSSNTSSSRSHIKMGCIPCRNRCSSSRNR